MTRPDHEHLKRLLAEDFQDDDNDALLKFMGQLHDLPVPQPSQQTTTNLIAMLQAEVTPLQVVAFSKKHTLGWMWLLLRSQVKVIQREIWLASLLMMLLGTLVTPAVIRESPVVLTPLAIIAPIIATVGVSLLYDEDMALIRDLENTTGTSIASLLFARLLLIFGFDLSLATAGSVFLSLIHPQLSLIPLIMTWLMPMTFLSALAFLTSVVSANGLSGGILSLSLWMLHIFLNTLPDKSIVLQILSLEGLSAVATRPYLMLISLPLIAYGLWLADRQENHIEGIQQ
jgi:hypothetical protein